MRTICFSLQSKSNICLTDWLPVTFSLQSKSAFIGTCFLSPPNGEECEWGGLVTNTKVSQLLCHKELRWGFLCLADSNNNLITLCSLSISKTSTWVSHSVTLQTPCNWDMTYVDRATSLMMKLSGLLLSRDGGSSFSKSSILKTRREPPPW